MDLKVAQWSELNWGFWGIPLTFFTMEFVPFVFA